MRTSAHVGSRRARDGRTSNPTVPLDFAAICHRRITVDETFLGHPTTAATLGQRRADQLTRIHRLHSQDI